MRRCKQVLLSPKLHTSYDLTWIKVVGQAMVTSRRSETARLKRKALSILRRAGVKRMAEMTRRLPREARRMMGMLMRRKKGGREVGGRRGARGRERLPASSANEVISV